MSRFSPRLGPLLLAGGLLLAGALSCGREITGPNGGGRAAAIHLDPQFKTIRLVGTGQVLSIGDTVFSGGPVDVTAKPASSGAPTPVALDIGYVGPGSQAASIEITPPSFTGLINQTPGFTAVVRDSSNRPLPLAPVAFTSTDSGRVRVDLRTGMATLLGARGGAMIIAQTLTGQADTATVGIVPVPTSLALVSGAAQQVRQGEPFPQPIRVRATAVDGLGVAGVEIWFSVVQGQGSIVQQLDTTDTSGEAQVTWIAGDSAGAAVMRAAIYESLIGVNVGGTQLSSAATSLTFSGNPANFTAGASIPSFTVIVRDATSDTVSSFNDVVSLGLAGGTAGANLVGAASVNAVNGVALVTGLPVDRAGTGYRLVASIPALPVVPWTIGAAGVQQVTATVTGVAPATINAAIATGGGTPVLFLGLDTVGIAIGRTRQIPAFLTNPTPTPLTVNLAVRDTTASWNVPSLAIPANGIQALPLLTRAFAGATWAIASSSAGTDSVRVTVDSAIAFIDGYANIQAAIGDTVRTLVMLPEPAGSGGVTLTVTSTDAAAVLVAPGSGRGVSEPICYSCSDLRAAPVGESKLLAPLAGTASITIPPGYLSAELVILPIGQGVSDGFVDLLLSGPGYVGVGKTVNLVDPDRQLYLYDAELGVGQRGEAYVYVSVRARRDEMVRMRSLDTEVATVDSLVLLPRGEYGTEYFYFDAIAPGTTQIIVEYANSSADTATVTVYPGRIYSYP